MMAEESREFDELEALLQPGREEELKTFLLLLHPADVADMIGSVDPEIWPRILKHLDLENAAELLSELDLDEQEEFLRRVKGKQLTGILDEMESDDIADLLQDLDEKTANEVFLQIPSEDQEEVRELLNYDPDSAGGIMQTELASVPAKSSIAEALEIVREAKEDVDPIITIFVVDHMGRYVGDLNLQDLIFENPKAIVEDVMEPPQGESIHTDLDQEDVAKIFDKYSLLEAAVVDRAGVLRGRITSDDVHEVIVEEAEEDMLALAGAPASEPDKIYTASVPQVAWMRLPWLFTTFFGGLTATVILQSFGTVFSNFVILLTFVPVITGMSGNVGTQSAMIMISGIDRGHIPEGKIMQNVARDLAIGLIIAVICGSAVAGLVAIWKGQAYLGLCIGVALACSMTTASILGSVEPPVLKRFGVDPAIAAGPLITSINDITGVLIYSIISGAFLRFLHH